MQIYLGPPSGRTPIDGDAGVGRSASLALGAVAQLGERRPCKAEVVGSIPISSTSRQSAGSEGGSGDGGMRGRGQRRSERERGSHDPKLGSSLTTESGSNKLRIQDSPSLGTQNLVKLLRVYGGCLGAERR